MVARVAAADLKLALLVVALEPVVKDLQVVPLLPVVVVGQVGAVVLQQVVLMVVLVTGELVVLDIMIA
jgi:hypothetical protein